MFSSITIMKPAQIASWLFYHHFRAVVTVDCIIKAGGPSIDYYKAVCPVYGAN